MSENPIMIDMNNPNSLVTLAMLGQFIREIQNQKGLVKICRDCKSEFIISEGEQRFFEYRNLTLPTRCKQCRAKKKCREERGV